MRTCGKSPLKKVLRLINRASMRKTVKSATEFYVISKIQKEEYQQWFKRDCKILTKSANFTNEPTLKDEYNNPLRLVYTGNLVLNRWKSLGLIASALQTINENEIKAQLYIYSGNTLTQEMRNALEKGESSFFMGSVPAEEIETVQKEADMLVHVEGLDKKSQNEVFQSFSTKLVDYFQSSRPILAVGPKNVASINHLIEN